MDIATELNIDYELLLKQKEELVTLIFNNPESILWGVVGILDALTDEQDNALERGDK
jgi:hypothetical protein